MEDNKEMPEFPIEETIIGTDLATIIDMLENKELGWYHQILLHKNDRTPILIFDEKCIEKTVSLYPSREWGTTYKDIGNDISISEYKLFLSSNNNEIVKSYKKISYPSPFFYGLKQNTIEIFLK